MPKYIDGKTKCGSEYRNDWNDMKKRRKMKYQRIDLSWINGYGVAIWVYKGYHIPMYFKVYE